MSHYIDGFVFPIPRQHVDEYKQVAEAVAEIWKEHGALEYTEFIGDDMIREGTRSFPASVDAREDEVIVFGWVKFATRESRDEINDKVASDPRMPELLAPIMDPAAPIFDASRMAYGGFKPFLSV